MFTLMDLLSIQECLEGYEVTIKMLPVGSPEEFELQKDRLRIIDYLQDKCEREIENVKRKV